MAVALPQVLLLTRISNKTAKKSQKMDNHPVSRHWAFAGVLARAFTMVSRSLLLRLSGNLTQCIGLRK